MKKLIVLVGFVFLASCASGGGGSMGYADPYGTYSTYGSPYINDSPSNPFGDGLRRLGK